MAANAAPTGGKPGGFLKNLSPKQKRYAAVIGAGALLALIYLVTRGRSHEEGPSPSSSEAAAAPESAVPSSLGGGGGTDPSAFLGSQSEAITERLGEVGSGLNEVGSGLNSLNEGLGTMGEGFKDWETSQEEADKRTAAALSKQSRQLQHIQSKLKRVTSGGHTASGGSKSGGGAKGGGGGGSKSGGAKGGSKSGGGAKGGGANNNGGSKKSGGKKK